ncbi:MAG: hypothetical protein J0I14_18845 [Propionibacteriaceae bacterium]|nr:hypothetical protein [Propionibacteriaceae bacterium]
MPVPRSVAFAVVTALLPVAGCVETPPGPLPQATPSWSCTPVAGGTPYACYEHQYQQTSAQNKLYEEAEAVYRKYHAEDERIFRLGGLTEPSQVLLETTTDAYLREAMAEYRGLKENHGGLIKGTYGIAWLKPLPDTIRAGFVATLEVCTDVSEATFRGEGGKPYQIGEDNAERLYFVRESELLKIGAADHQRVKSC